MYYIRPHISVYLRNDAALTEKLPILVASLRFVTSYAVNPQKNLYKPLLLRNYRNSHFKMNRAFKVILIGASRNPERIVVVMYNNGDLIS